MEFEGKVAVITGAAKGIGYTAARLFAEKGAYTVLIDRDEEDLKTAFKSIIKSKEKGRYCIADVSDEKSINEIIEDILKNNRKIDILVNNAGIYHKNRGPFVDSVSDTWKEKINVNILGTMYCTKAVLKSMIEQRYGRIINIASVAAEYGIANMVDYSMTKGAVVSFTRALAKEVSEFNVLVNAVSPGNINDDISRHPDFSYMNRSGTTEECANLIVFLASDEASFISGQNYQIDGCRKKM